MWEASGRSLAGLVDLCWDLGGIWEDLEASGRDGLKKLNTSLPDCKSCIKGLNAFMLFEGHLTIDCYLPQLMLPNNAHRLRDVSWAIYPTPSEPPQCKHCLGNYYTISSLYDYCSAFFIVVFYYIISVTILLHPCIIK